MVGLTRFELVTPRLSSVCSNQLSYRPRHSGEAQCLALFKDPSPVLSKLDSARFAFNSLESQIDHREAFSVLLTAFSTC
jgi:hypothetical protein